MKAYFDLELGFDQLLLHHSHGNGYGKFRLDIRNVLSFTLISRFGTSLFATMFHLVVLQALKPSFNCWVKTWRGGCIILSIIDTLRILSDTHTPFVKGSHYKPLVERAAFTQPHVLLFGAIFLTPGQVHWPKPVNTQLHIQFSRNSKRPGWLMFS